MRFWALAFFLAAAIAGVAAAKISITARATIIVSNASRGGLFDNGGNPWPFTGVTPGIAYNTGGQHVGYTVTPRTEPACQVVGSSYRSDYQNFKTSTWTAQPSIPYTLCGSTTLPSGGDSHTYAISVAESGAHTLTVYTVNPNSGAQWSILLDGAPLTTMTMTGNGNPGDFSTVSATVSPQFTLSTGKHNLTLIGTAGDPAGNYIGDLAGWQGAIVTSSGVPPQAAAAGFTTQVLSIDFTTVGTNWPSQNIVGCGSPPVPASQPNNPSTWHWYWERQHTTTPMPCNQAEIVTDPVYGNQALHIYFDPSNWLGPPFDPTGTAANFIWPNSFTQGTSTSWLGEEVYYSMTIRRPQPGWDQTGGNKGYFIQWGTSNFAGSPSTDCYDLNTAETNGTSGANPEYDVGGTGVCSTGGFGNSPTIPYSAPHYTTDPYNYETIEGLTTSDGASDFWECIWDNNVFIGCVDINPTYRPPGNNAAFARNMGYGVTIGDYVAQNTFRVEEYIKDIHIWACSKFASQSCLGTMITNCAQGNKC